MNQCTRVFLLVSSLFFSTTNSFTVQSRITHLDHRISKLEEFIMDDFRGLDMPLSIQDDLNLEPLLNQLEDLRNQRQSECVIRDMRAKLQAERAEGNEGRRVRPLRIVRRTPGRAFGAVKRVIPQKKKHVAVIAGIAVASVRFSARI